MSRPQVERPKAAERIHAAAKALFHRQGIRATGIEEVCRAAEATKMSLYRAYPSKDALVAAILEEDAACYDAWFAAATAGAATPADKLRAVVETIAARLPEPDSRGCPLLQAQAEFPDPDHPTHQLVAQHKRRIRDALEALAREAGAREPEALADALALLVDGAFSSISYLGADRAAAALRRGAERAFRAAFG